MRNVLGSERQVEVKLFYSKCYTFYNKGRNFSGIQLYEHFETLNNNGLYLKKIFFQMLKIVISNFDIGTT